MLSKFILRRYETGVKQMYRCFVINEH